MSPNFIFGAGVSEGGEIVTIAVVAVNRVQADFWAWVNGGSEAAWSSREQKGPISRMGDFQKCLTAAVGRLKALQKF